MTNFNFNRQAAFGSLVLLTLTTFTGCNSVPVQPSQTQLQATAALGNFKHISTAADGGLKSVGDAKAWSLHLDPSEASPSIVTAFNGYLTSSQYYFTTIKQDSIDGTTSIGNAITSDVKNNAIWNQTHTADVNKINKLENSWGHKLQLVVDTFFWFIIGTLGISVIVAIVGSFMNPATALFKISQEIIRALPLMNPIRWINNLFGSRTVTVPAVVVPDVAQGVVLQ